MTLEVRFAVTVAAAFLSGWLIAWVLTRPRLSRLERNLAVCEEKARAIAALQQDLALRDEGLEKLRNALAETTVALTREKERASRLSAAEEKIAEGERVVEKLRDRLAEKEARIRELETRLDQENLRSEEKLALVAGARAELSAHFQVLAQEILDEKGRAFGEQTRAGLRTLLDPFRDQLESFRNKVDSVQLQETRERASLKSEIEALRDLNRQIGQEALNLTRALRGDKQAQGIWGEMVLERVLEKSGLRKGLEYETQTGFRDPEGRLLRPDVVVHLPEGKEVVIDSKVSLIAYERFANAEDDTERRAALAAHVSAVKAHIDELSRKDYGSVRGIRSLDFVLCFMPVEAAFVAAFRQDENLFSHAFEKRIVVVTPTTLLATLKTIESIWRYERRNRNARDIVARAGAIYDKLRLFVETLERLGKQIETVHATFDEAMNRLVRGKGNVISQAYPFSALGVSVKKELPRTVTDVADIDRPKLYDAPDETGSP